MQYINSNLGIPIKSAFKDMLGANGMASATGSSASDITSKIAAIQKQIDALSVKKQREEGKLEDEENKRKRGASQRNKGGFSAGQKQVREAEVAVEQAKTEIRRIDTEIRSLQITLSDYSNQLKSFPASPQGSTPPTPPPASPRPLGESGSSLLSPSASLVPLPDDGTSSTGAQATTPISNKKLLQFIGLGIVGYLILTYYFNKKIKNFG